MLIGILEVVTVISALRFLDSIFVSQGPFQDVDEGAEECIWYLKALRTGSAKKRFRHLLMNRKKLQRIISLGEGSFRAGNSLMDDIYIDISGPGVSLYLNVWRDKLYLSVLKGSVRINSQTYHADAGRRIEVHSGQWVDIGDVAIKFNKER